jgi:hypothetical protein
MLPLPRVGPIQLSAWGSVRATNSADNDPLNSTNGIDVVDVSYKHLYRIYGRYLLITILE